MMFFWLTATHAGQGLFQMPTWMPWNWTPDLGVGNAIADSKELSLCVIPMTAAALVLESSLASQEQLWFGDKMQSRESGSHVT